MNEVVLPESRERVTERIVVALDASSHSVAALRAAVELAALMEAELEGLFIEDINLIHLCDFPFCYEIGSYTAKIRQLDNASMERQLRVIAERSRQLMQQTAGNSPVRWSFQVRRGPVVNELLMASQDAVLVTLGRASQMRRRTLGSTVRSLVRQSRRPVLILGEENRLEYPLTVLYTGSPASQRALHLAASLAQRHPSSVRVVLWGGNSEDVEAATLEQEARQLLAAEGVQGIFVRVHQSADMLATLQLYDGGTLVLPGEHSRLIDQYQGPALVVP